MSRRNRREDRPAFVPFDVKVPKERCPDGGKIRFEELEAKLVVANVQAKDSPWRPKLEQRAYRCAACGDWHTTSQPLLRAGREES